MGAPQGRGKSIRKRSPLPEMSSTDACRIGPGLNANTLTVAIWFGLNRHSRRRSIFDEKTKT
jgi:hypothetical protein